MTHLAVSCLWVSLCLSYWEFIKLLGYIDWRFSINLRCFHPSYLWLLFLLLSLPSLLLVLQLCIYRCAWWCPLFSRDLLISHHHSPSLGLVTVICSVASWVNAVMSTSSLQREASDAAPHKVQLRGYAHSHPGLTVVWAGLCLLPGAHPDA